ncbi:unnamed protein product [Rotaria sp. Silwood2]|nr:unnamed protein product [Rotaria sp. Silwood2]CAF3411520.1 unnamed protein product [Rotaria sp. Silwood2]CAF4464513.1 unnamed protein product [Rotaria sp. Silwood2]
MQTVDDIIFDNTIYPLARVWALLLYEMRGTHIAILLPNAHLMPYIRPFQNTTACQNHIDMNNQRMITLFTYENNMQWLTINLYFNNTPQLRKINIFCSSVEDQEYWTTWTARYRDKIDEPFLYAELDLKLLLFGFYHIPQVRQHFRNDNAVLNRLREDERHIRRAFQFVALNLRDNRGDAGLGSVPIGISKVSGLWPLNVPIVGCVSTFDINEWSG